MKKLLGLFVLLVLLTAVVVGCGGGKEAVEDNKTPDNASEEENKAEAPESEEEEEVEAAWPRTYVDALEREIVLEKKPERPALIFFRNFEHLFSIGEAPVAAADVQDVFLGWESLKPFAENSTIIDIGDMWSANAEILLEANPDLIIVFSGVYEEIGEQLEKIATVITVNNYGDDWKTPMREYGKIFGKEDVAEAEINRLQTLLSETQEKLASYEDKTFTFFAMRGKDFTVFSIEFVYSEENGLGLTAPIGYVEKSRENISLEGVAEFNPDYIFLYNDALTETDEERLKELEQDTIWNSLTAVKEDQVFLIDRSTFSGGPLAIEYGVNVILAALNE